MTILLIALAAVCAVTIVTLSVRLARTKSELRGADSVIADLIGALERTQDQLAIALPTDLIGALERTQDQLANALPTPKEPTYL